MTIAHHAHSTFEETYPRAPFADLIRLALSLAERIVKLRAWMTGAVPAIVGPRQHA